MVSYSFASHVTTSQVIFSSLLRVFSFKEFLHPAKKFTNIYSKSYHSLPISSLRFIPKKIESEGAVLASAEGFSKSPLASWHTCRDMCKLEVERILALHVGSLCVGFLLTLTLKAQTRYLETSHRQCMYV